MISLQPALYFADYGMKQTFGLGFLLQELLKYRVFYDFTESGEPSRLRPWMSCRSVRAVQGKNHIKMALDLRL